MPPLSSTYHLDFVLRMFEFSLSGQKNETMRRYIQQGDHQALLQQYQEALQSYSTAIKLDRSFIHAYIRRAEIYITTGELALAINDYNTVIKLQPGEMLYYHDRVIIVDSQC